MHNSPLVNSDQFAFSQQHHCHGQTETVIIEPGNLRSPQALHSAQSAHTAGNRPLAAIMACQGCVLYGSLSLWGPAPPLTAALPHG